MKDSEVLEILLHKATVAYDEARLQYKTPAQLMAFLERADYSEKQKEYMEETDPVKRFALDLDSEEDLFHKLFPNEKKNNI